MRFELLQEDRGDIRILALAGAFESRAATALQKSLEGTLTDGRRAVLLDLEHLESISVTSLRVMTTAAARLKTAGGALALCCPQAQVEKVLELTDRTLPYFADRDAACDWLAETVRRERVARLATWLLRRNERKQPLFRMQRADLKRTALAARLLRRETPGDTIDTPAPRR